MKKMLLATALALLVTGCAQQTFTVQNKPAAVTQRETITHHFLRFWNWAKKTVPDAAKICGGAENTVKQKRQTLSWMLGFITLGIYTPLEARVYCSQ